MRARLLLACAPLFGVACAIWPGPAGMPAHLRGVVPEDVRADRPRLGVLALVDGRSRSDRVGSSPSFHFSLRGVSRTGTWRTSDASFAGEIVQGVRRDAIATLKRSGVFSHVRGVMGWDDAGDLDLLLLASLEEFGGAQSLRASLSLLRAGWLRRSIGEPTGSVRVRYQLYARQGKRWEHRIETRVVVPGQSLERAALDAMAITHERLAQALFHELPGATALRRIPARVLDACGADAEEISGWMLQASQLLEREADLLIEPTIEPWTPPAGAHSADALLAALRRTIASGDGIVIAFVPQPAQVGLLGQRESGLAHQLGAHLLISHSPDHEVSPQTIAHEIAHLFGAVHVRDRASLMSARAEFDARFLDLLNRRILRTMRLRPFDRPLPNSLRDALSSLYRDAAAAPAHVSAADLERALSNLRGAN